MAKTQSTISRLESKYSDVLGRIANRRRETKKATDDKEKTLEPDPLLHSNALTRSATTILAKEKPSSLYTSAATNAATYRDQSPYRNTARSRNKYEPLDSNYRYRGGGDLGFLHDSTNYRYNPRSDYDPLLRRKDTYYDAYSRYGGGAVGGLGAAPTTSSRYYDHDLYSSYRRPTATGTMGYGYYDGRNVGKENMYKSKYDPSALYAELSNNSESFYGDNPSSVGGTKSKRQFRSYKKGSPKERRHTTVLKLLNEEDENRLNKYSSPVSSTAATSRYTTRKSMGDGLRSHTQRFFDTENQLDGGHTAHENGIDDTSLTPDRTARNAKRKEIQSLIMKYAQIDDVYNRATDHDANNNHIDTATVPTPTALASSGSGPKGLTGTNGISGGYSNGVGHHSGIASVSSLKHRPYDHLDLYTSGAYAYHPSYATGAHGGYGAAGGFLPLAKTHSTSSMATYKSRIPMTLSTFVRYKSFTCYHIILKIL